MNIVSKIIFGSRLYGTYIEKTSDWDFRGVFLSTKEDCYLNRIKNSWNDLGEEDTQYWSLHYFLELASQGQSAAIELLCAPSNYWHVSSDIWSDLHYNRKRFFSKNMHSFIGYAKSMSQKYSSRIDRLNETEAIFKVLNQWDDKDRLSDIWNELPESLNAVKSVNERNKNADKRSYVVCGRELQATVTVSHAKDVVGRIHSSYGERVKNAKEGNIDWKALSHAFRACYQVREIALTSDLKFPLKNANYLRDMRLGKINFLENGLDKKLDELIEETQVLIDKSNLPDKIDGLWVDNFVLDIYRNL